MGVKVVELPRKGSGRWFIRINFEKWRKTKLVGVGEEGERQAHETARYLAEAFRKFGKDAMRLVEPPRPDSEMLKAVPTVAEYALRFMRAMRGSDLKRTTIEMYESNLKLHVVPILGNARLNEIDYACARDFVTGKSTSKYRRGKGENAKEHVYSKDSIRVMAVTLRVMLSEAVREKIISSNPVSDLSKFYRKRRKERAVTRSQVYTLAELHKVEAKICERFPEIYEFTLAMSREGMRIGEAVALLVSDVDFSRETISITKNVPSGTRELEHSAKSQAGEREIEFSSEEFKRALQEMIRRRKERCLAEGKILPLYLFPNEVGRAMDYSNFLKKWNRAAVLAGVRAIRPHWLRHTWASHQLEAGESIAWVSKHLGHANPGVTMSIYVHFIPREKRKRTSVMNTTTIPERDVETKTVGANRTQMEDGTE